MGEHLWEVLSLAAWLDLSPGVYGTRHSFGRFVLHIRTIALSHSLSKMERSSPLAAMQAQSVPFGQWGFHLDGPTSNPRFGRGMGCGSSSFNFKDLSMAQPRTDFFSLKPIRGSSPTASLAADLSQNFHIDQRYLPALITWSVS